MNSQFRVENEKLKVPAREVREGWHKGAKLQIRAQNPQPWEKPSEVQSGRCLGPPNNTLGNFDWSKRGGGNWRLQQGGFHVQDEYGVERGEGDAVLVKTHERFESCRRESDGIADTGS